VYGAPAKVTSKIAEKERSQIKKWAEEYCGVAANYLGRLAR
jgi:carbonic anhydrase/acetyltransferase-like protein (isoleucine patch superfamily)